MGVLPRGKTARITSVGGFPGVIGTFMGRDALTLAMAHLGISASDTVLLPAYTCQEVLRSFVKKVNVVFYDVQPDLTIDPDELRRKVSGERVKMVLTTDYFGFLQPYRLEIKQICADAGASFVEDCAHSLLTDGAGLSGDLAIYSFRKIVPVHDGGGLRINPAQNAAAIDFRPRFFSNALSLVAQAKSLLNIHTPMLSRARVASHTTDVIAPVKADDRILPLSSFAQHGMSHISFPDVIKRRRDDFLFWRDVARADPALVPLFEELPPGVCPLGFPVKVRDRPSLEAQARKAGIVLSVHWRLERDLAPECRTSHELSAQLLTLPVGPDIRSGERDTLARIVSEEWRRCA
jgi:perosamine synthetase